MTKDDTTIKPSLLSQILHQTLDGIAKEEHFDESHVESIRSLINGSGLTDSKLADILLLEQKGETHEDHRA